MKDFLKAPKTKTLLYTLCGILAILVVFGVGVIVGYRRAEFAERWSENYYPNFLGVTAGGGPLGMLFGPFDTHGVVGRVVMVGTTTIAVEDRDGDEQSVVVGTNTPIRKMNGMISIIAIQDGDYVTVIGQPNDTGQVEANFIRVFSPAPPATSSVLVPGPAPAGNGPNQPQGQ
jgi:hypothetical protein